MPMRPASSTCSVLMNPSPSSPTSASAGTRQSWKITSLVSLARMPSLFSFLPADRPGVPRSTTNAEMPCRPCARSVTAITTSVPPIVPCVMNCLLPLMTQSSPSRRAVVRIAAASLPALGLGQAPGAERLALAPAATRYSLLLRLAAEHRTDARAHSPLCAATDSAIDGSTRASSSMQMQYSTADMPAPPYASGTWMPISPSAASLRQQRRPETPAPRPTP